MCSRPRCGLPDLYPPGHLLHGRPAAGMVREIFPHLAVSGDDLPDEVSPGARFFQFARCARRGRDQSLDLEFIRIDHQPDHRLLIVGIAADVGQHAKARAFGRAELGGSEEEDGEENFHRETKEQSGTVPPSMLIGMLLETPVSLLP